MDLWLPLLVSYLIALLGLSPLIRALAGGRLQQNYRGVEVASPAGALLVFISLLTLGVLAFIQAVGGPNLIPSQTLIYALFLVGVALVGLIDDTLSSGGRGFRGHFQDLIAGRFSTGSLKVVGISALAMLVLMPAGLKALDYLLAVVVLVLATNFFNLLDLRPGRSIKFLILLAVPLWAISGDSKPLQALGAFIGPILAYLPFDLKERAMLGDTGSNLVGALAGLCLVAVLGTVGLVVAGVLLLALTVYGDRRSLGDKIEKTPLLSAVDSLGRNVR